MKKSIYIPVLLFFMAIGFAFTASKNNNENEGINFQEISLKEGLKLAKKEKKLVLVYFHASWCGPCRLMKKETFSDKQVGEFYNKNFVNLSVDSEKKEGPSLVRKYEINSIPYFLVFNSDSKMVAKTYGFYDANDFIVIGKKILNQKNKN
jgi:thioredoxin-related protein